MSGQAVDFALWNTLLQQYVDHQGRVDYAAWKRQPQTLTRWLAELESLPTLEVDRNQHLALWINLYNAFTIDKILRRHPIASIRPQILGVPNWLEFLWFFGQPDHRFSGEQYSLSRIEHKILRPLQDPRIHFAIVCASIGCPLLRNEAYAGDRVQQQLEDDARRFINNSDKVRYDAATDRLYCSQIFKWYRQDFLQVATSVPDYICAYHHDLPLTASTALTYLDYDWNLNQRISS